MARSSPSVTRVRTRQVVHPEFKQAAETELDPYWKQLLVEASHGEFGKMTVYADGKLSRKDSVAAPTRVPKTNPEMAAHIFIRFHKKYERTLSDQELERHNTKRQEVCSRPVVLTWPSASIQMRRAALNHYAVRTVDTMHFESEVERGRCTRNLSAILFTALGMKLLDKDSVRIEGNIVTHISCVRYDEAYKVWILVAHQGKTR